MHYEASGAPLAASMGLCSCSYTRSSLAFIVRVSSSPTIDPQASVQGKNVMHARLRRPQGSSGGAACRHRRNGYASRDSSAASMAGLHLQPYPE